MSKRAQATRKTLTRGAEKLPKGGKGGDDTGGPKARDQFTVERRLPPVGSLRPMPREDEGIVRRVQAYDVQPAVLPEGLIRSLGMKRTVPLDGQLSAAASSSGYAATQKALGKAAYQKARKAMEEGRVPRPPEVGSVVWSEPVLRKAFHSFDLDKNDAVGAKELKNVFAQFGEAPSDQEIDGMIHLCDLRGEGQIILENFLAIFSNPAESLRNVDVESLQQVVNAGNTGDSSDEDSEEETP